MRGGFLSNDKRKVQRSQPMFKSCLRFQSKGWLLGPALIVGSIKVRLSDELKG
jgi:hypothetical protein